VRVVKASGLSAIAQNVLYVDNKPVWSITPNQTIKTVYAIFRSAINIQLPTAVDPDGDVVTYAATNLPSGLTANSTTGLISGSLADVSSDTTYSPTVKALSTGSDPGATQIETTRTVNIVQKAGIGNSLRFDGTSYLSRTPTTDSGTDYNKGRKFTLSFWIKISNLSANQSIFCGSLSRPTFDIALLYASGKPSIVTNVYNGSGYDMYNITNFYLRDTSAWYHFLFEIDTTSSTESDRYKVYVNSNLQTLSGDTGRQIYPNQNHQFDVATANLQRVFGAFSFGSVAPLFNGYLANIQFIDGQALSASDFGESVNGIWTPKTYLGTYGTNGFWLRFDDSSQIGKDSSGNGNHWTAN